MPLPPNDPSCLPSGYALQRRCPGDLAEVQRPPKCVGETPVDPQRLGAGRGGAGGAPTASGSQFLPERQARNQEAPWRLGVGSGVGASLPGRAGRGRSRRSQTAEEEPDGGGKRRLGGGGQPRGGSQPSASGSPERASSLPAGRGHALSLGGRRSPGGGGEGVVLALVWCS